MFKKKYKEGFKNLKEVRLGAFVNKPRMFPERDRFLEIDENSLRRVTCYVEEDVAIDINGNSYYVLQREEDNKIKSSEIEKIFPNILYVLEINNKKEISFKEAKQFLKSLEISLETKRLSDENKFEQYNEQHKKIIKKS